MLMTSSTNPGIGDSRGGNPRLPQPVDDGPPEIDSGLFPGTCNDRNVRELSGNLRTHFETTRADGRSQKGLDGSRIRKRRHGRFDHPRHHSAPTRVERGHACTRRGKNHGDAVRGAHGQLQSGHAGANRVAGRERSGVLGPAQHSAVHLLHAYRVRPFPRSAFRCTKGPPNEPHIGEFGRKWMGAKHVIPVFHSPGPLHGGGA